MKALNQDEVPLLMADVSRCVIWTLLCGVMGCFVVWCCAVLCGGVWCGIVGSGVVCCGEMWYCGE